MNGFIPLPPENVQTYQFPKGPNGWAIAQETITGRYYVLSAIELGELLIEGCDLVVRRTNKA